MKNAKVIVCLVLAMVLVALCACGNGKYKSISAFVEAEVQDSIDEMNEEYKDMGMSIELTGEGNKLIYTFKYLEIENMDGLAEALEKGLADESTASTFTDLAAQITEAVNVKDPVVVVKYVDMNDEEIYSQEFTAE